MGGTILWGFMMSMSIGTKTEIGGGGGGTAIEALSLGRNKMVMVLLRRVKLQNPPSKMALAFWFLIQCSTALY
jgi:hypothetical protein